MGRVPRRHRAARRAASRSCSARRVTCTRFCLAGRRGPLGLQGLWQEKQGISIRRTRIRIEERSGGSGGGGGGFSGG
eukprot:9494980-Pyramimonas_sp.AAC.1